MTKPNPWSSHTFPDVFGSDNSGVLDKNESYMKARHSLTWNVVQPFRTVWATLYPLKTKDGLWRVVTI